MAVKVSLIVPVYNTAGYLGPCIDSLLGQTMRETEIILVDDGSEDGSCGLCDRYALQDPRIQVIHKENSGPGSARNSGLEQAVGEYVGFVDSDDYVRPEMYEKLYQAALETDADIVLAGMHQVGGNLFASDEDKEVGSFLEREIFEGQDGRRRLMLGMVGAQPWEKEDSRYDFSVCKNLYRRDLIERNSLCFPSERDGEDLLFHLRLINHMKRGVGIPGSFYCYRRNEGSFTRRYRSDLFLQSRKLAAVIERELRELLPEVDAQLYIDRMLQARARVALVTEMQHAGDGNGGYVQVKHRLREISRDEKLQEVLHRYPYWKLPKKQAVFAFAMRHRMTMLQYLLFYLKGRG